MTGELKVFVNNIRYSSKEGSNINFDIDDEGSVMITEYVGKEARLSAVLSLEIIKAILNSEMVTGRHQV